MDNLSSISKKLILLVCVLAFTNLAAQAISCSDDDLVESEIGSFGTVLGTSKSFTLRENDNSISELGFDIFGIFEGEFPSDEYEYVIVSDEPERFRFLDTTADPDFGIFTQVLISLPLNYEETFSYPLKIRAIAPNCSYVEEEVTVVVADEFELPSSKPETDCKMREDGALGIIELANNTVTEGLGNQARQLVGRVDLICKDFENPVLDSELSFSLVGEENEHFEIERNSFRNNLYAINGFNFNEQNSFNLTIRADYTDGRSLENNVNIFVQEKTFCEGSAASNNDANGNLVINDDFIPSSYITSDWNIGNFTVNDGDFNSNEYFYSIVGGENINSFSLSSTGLLKATRPLFTGDYSLTIRAQEPGCEKYIEQDFTFTPQNSEEFYAFAPSNTKLIGLSDNLVPENWGITEAANDIEKYKYRIGYLNTLNAGFETNLPEDFNYEIIGGDTNYFELAREGSFTILRSSFPLDFEEKSLYSIRVRSNYKTGENVSERDFNIRVIDLESNEPSLKASSVDNGGTNSASGTLTLSENTLEEAVNLPEQIIGEIDITNKDYFSLAYYDFEIIGSNSVLFGIKQDPSGSVYLFAKGKFDFEDQSAYSVRIRAIEPDGDYLENVFNIEVENKLLGNGELRLSENEVLEGEFLNSGKGNYVGRLSVDSGDFDSALYNYEVVDNNSKFTIENQGLLRANTPLSFDDQTSFDVTVRATDPEGEYIEQTFTINVITIDTDDSDPDQEGTNSAKGTLSLSDNTVPENWTISNYLIGFAKVEGGDLNSRFSYKYSLVSDNRNLFEVSSIGTVRALTPFDFEKVNEYVIRVRATEPEGNYLEQNFIINVTNEIEAGEQVEEDEKEDSENDADDEDDYLRFDQGNDLIFDSATRPRISKRSLILPSENPLVTFKTKSPMPSLDIRVLNKVRDFMSISENNGNYELKLDRKLTKKFRKRKFLNLRLAITSPDNLTVNRRFKIRLVP
ncbi:MAG: cadherin repeat domain-containing protein [Candidatus Caenarcaniphilales bacterium]|nr:cadherin repeat domain-containing protein [Candidatus Caenarcaniphilales bacterium]